MRTCQIKKDDRKYYDYSETVYPDGLEKTPPKYAITKRNKWMIAKSDYVVTYVKVAVGGATTYKDYAEKKNKIVINIADLE